MNTGKVTPFDRHIRERICGIVLIARNLSASVITNLLHYYVLLINQQFLIFRNVTVAFTLYACSFYMHHTSYTVSTIRAIRYFVLLQYTAVYRDVTLAILASSRSCGR